MHTTLASGTDAYLARRDGSSRSLVIVPDIWGIRPLFTEMCETLADRTGWSVGAFEPFPGQDLPGMESPDGLEARSAALRALADADLLGDAAAVAHLLGEQPCGLIGFCMGGMYALKAAGHGRFDRVAAFYGMIRVPENWSGPGHEQPLDRCQVGSADVMAIVGTADAWTPPEDVDALEAVGVEVVRYEGADHGFVHDPSRPAHRADYAEDAWNRVLEFLGA